MVTLEIENGSPLASGQARVHVAHGSVHFRLDLLVTGDARAAGRGELNEDEPLAVLRPTLEEAAHGPDAFGQPLGVVEPLDAHPQELARDTEFAQDVFTGRLGRVKHELRGHADGEGLDESGPLAARDGELLPLHAGLDGPLGRLQEIVAVVLRMKADDVRAQHAQEQLLLPGADAESFGVGPRDVPEESDAGVGARALDEAGQEREVVVLDEDERRLDVGRFLEHGGRELLVHRAVVRPVFRTELWPRVHDVAERPQSLVGEAEVVPRFLLLLSQTRRRVKSGSSCGNAMRPCSSDISRSASPLAWATHTPPHARITGSMAVTRPEAGRWPSMRPAFQTWLSGSRLETTKRGDSPRRSFANCLRRSSVQSASPTRRSAASSSAAARARCRLLAMTETSWATGPKMLGSAMSRGGGPMPRRSAFVQRAILVKGWITLIRTIRKAMTERTTARTRKRMPLSRHRRHSASTTGSASRATRRAPITRSSRSTGLEYTYRGRPPRRTRPPRGSFPASAAVTWGCA